MERDFKEITVQQLLQKYKRLSRNAPITMYASDKELDDYCNKLLEIENEIIRRTQITTE